MLSINSFIFAATTTLNKIVMQATPVLFIIFNRPETTQQVFNAIRQQQPAQLFVAADGPRVHKPGEQERCEQTRLIIEQVDWPCEVRKLYHSDNLGCDKAVTMAISWFFDAVEQGIILEDDCIPHPDFWEFTGSLLEKYKNEPAIKVIGGSNFQNGQYRGEGSYYFSAIPHIWGWATWRRTWKEYDYDIAKHTSDAELLKMVEQHYAEKDARKYWLTIWRYIKEGRPITWDYRLTYSVWKHRGLSIIPNVNLVSNIGFGADATTTVDEASPLAKRATGAILPVRHPATIVRNKVADDYFYKAFFHNTLKVTGLRKKVEELIPWKLRKKLGSLLK